MRLLIDENLDSAELIALLRQAGHHVETREKGTLDPEVWAQAQQHALVVRRRRRRRGSVTLRP